MKNILVVEDDIDLAEMVKMRLSHSNYKISLAVDGKEALNKISQERFDLIILDIMLPEMNGYEVCKKLKANVKYKDIPVLMFTAKGEKGSQDEAFRSGADAYIVKPYEPNVLLYKIKSLLAKE